MASLNKVGRRVLVIVADIIAFSVFTYGLLYYFFGVTTITANYNDESITSKVFINDELRGETPLQLRLGMGTFNIKIVPPEGYRAEHEMLFFTSIVSGMEISETLKKLEYKVTLYSPDSQPRSFQVFDASNNPIAACADEVCEISLPGPGAYRALVDKFCWETDQKGRICTGKREFNFNLSPEHSEEEIGGWN